MGIFSFDAIRSMELKLLKDQQRFVLEEYARYCDDNTDYPDVVNVMGDKNIIGYHTYPALHNMHKSYDKSFTSLKKARKDIVAMDLMKEAERQLSRKLNVTTYTINFSKIFRLGDYYKTVEQLDLDEDSEIVKAFFDSAFKSYEDDYLTFPVRRIVTRQKGLVIPEWEQLSEEGDAALEQYWRSYREKSIGADGNNTNTYNTTKEHKLELSNSDDSIVHQDNDNQDFEIQSHRQFNDSFPAEFEYKSSDGSTKVVTLGREHMNCKHQLDPYYYQFENEQDKEDFLNLETGALQQLRDYNDKWKEKLKFYYTPSSRRGSLGTGISLTNTTE